MFFESTKMLVDEDGTHLATVTEAEELFEWVYSNFYVLNVRPVSRTPAPLSFRGDREKRMLRNSLLAMMKSSPDKKFDVLYEDDFIDWINMHNITDDPSHFSPTARVVKTKNFNGNNSYSVVSKYMSMTSSFHPSKPDVWGRSFKHVDDGESVHSEVDLPLDIEKPYVCFRVDSSDSDSSSI